MVLVPTGATEQHGPHGPLGTDVIVAREVCRRVAEAKSALVAPPIPYGLSAATKGFKGVASLKTETFAKLITDVTRSLADGGFRRIVFVNGHATNYAAINLALPRRLVAAAGANAGVRLDVLGDAAACAAG